MIKPRVYVESSVVSHYYADDTPEKRDITRKLWEQLKRGEYEIVVSPVVYEEIEDCGTQEEIDALYDVLNMLEYTEVEETEKSLSLANEYLETGVLPARARADCRHIAVASISDCKYILSWNMKHFVKRRTIEMVQEINGKLGVYQPNIQTPAIFIEGDDDNE
ncbi:MAG: PIN domain-containing protein [Clostridiales bacterium]|nr:PIN domain-containing protein [Clostridiales bacterium]